MTPDARPPDSLERAFEAVARAASRRDLDALLAMLERLDGAEEAAVVRSALGAGVSPEVAVGEVQREVERRLERALRAD